MKKYAWFVLLIFGTIAVYIYTQGTGGDSAKSEAKALDLAAGSSLTQLPDNQAGGISAPTSVRKSLLVDVVADQIARKGISSTEVADLVSISQGACSAYSDKVKQGKKFTSWANDYFSSSCQDFDGSQYQGLEDPAPDFLEISMLSGQGAAEEAALRYLGRPNSVLAALGAGTLLIGSGKFPEQESYRLSVEQLSRAFAAANASTMCPGQNGCAAAQVLVASTCLETPCPLGISYESALRRGLSPGELKASTRLKQWLISIKK